MWFEGTEFELSILNVPAFTRVVPVKEFDPFKITVPLSTLLIFPDPDIDPEYVEVPVPPKFTFPELVRFILF